MEVLKIKICIECKNNLDDSCFRMDKRTIDGLARKCNDCNVLKTKYYEANREHLIKKNRQWALDNPEKASEARRRFREDKKDIKFKWDKQWKRDNKEYFKKYCAEYRRINKDAIRRYNLKRMMNKSHEISKEEWEFCKLYFNYSCAYCGISEKEAKKQQGQNLHKEHAVNEGSDGIDNCVPSCRICNSKKWMLDYDEWYSPDNPIYSHDRYMKIEKWLKGDFQIVNLI